MWKCFFYKWPIKKNEIKMSIERHISESAELDGGGGVSEFFFFRGRKPNRKIYRGENRKWLILQG